MKIKFKDLSGWLRLAVIFAWIYAGVFSVAFIYGFVGALI